MIVRLARREGFGDVSFRWTGRRTLIGIVAGIAFPVAIGTIAYGLAWMLGLADLDIPDRLPGGAPAFRFLYVLVLNGGVLGLYGLIGAAVRRIDQVESVGPYAFAVLVAQHAVDVGLS